MDGDGKVREEAAMIRILHVINSMDRGGGAQALLMDYYRNIDREQVQFDFVIHKHWYGDKALFEDEINALGGKIYFCEANRVRHPLKYAGWWRKFFQEHPGYDIVEGHIPTSGSTYLTEAKRAGCYTIAHSHSTWEKGGQWLHGFLSKIAIWPVRFVADDFVACSLEAGTDYFGKRIARSDRFRVVNNVIDCDRFVYSAAKRAAVRAVHGLGDAFVVGNPTRFAAPKNHFKLLEVFKALRDRLPSARLLLLGSETGPLYTEVRKRCTDLGLDDAVVFAGLRENVEDYYSAMDVFCFPSLWEGLGMVAVEAQTNGLPCVVSDTVPRAADIGAGLFEPLSLQQSSEEWADAILAQREKRQTDGGSLAYARKAGYDAKAETGKLQQFYCTRPLRRNNA